MRCSNCGADYSADAHYCGACGRSIESLADESFDQAQLEFTGEKSSGASAFEPRDLRALLVESSRVYRKNLPVFLGIGLIPQIPGLFSLGPMVTWLAVILIVISLVLTALSFGAITRAVADDYLGLHPSVMSSYFRARERVVPLVVCMFIHLVLLAISLFLSLVIVGIPMLLALLVVLWFYPQAIMLENLGPVEAFRRSVSLVRGNWLRVFGVGVAYWAVPAAVALAVLALSNDPANSRLMGISSAIIGTVTTPWILIGSTLLYFDLRVRKEGYSLESLEDESERNGSS